MFLLNNLGLLLEYLWQHLQMVSLGVSLALPLAIGLSLVLQALPWLRTPMLASLAMLYTIPSLALMIGLLPWLGLNSRTVIVAIVLYAQVILVRQLDTGLNEIPADICEAAQAMGMTPWQQFREVQAPLLLPVLIAGLRLATLVGIAIAVLGAKFGAGGLGVWLFEGISQGGRADKIWASTLALVVLSLGVNSVFTSLENRNPLIQPPQADRNNVKIEPPEL